MDTQILYVHPVLIVIFVICFVSWRIYRSCLYKSWQGGAFIRNYSFPSKVARVLKEKHPHLTDEDIDKVFDALKVYFLICKKNSTNMVSMPSKVVDDAWHEFILFTRQYSLFCQKGMCRFLHHSPAEAMLSKKDMVNGMARAWRHACEVEGINYQKPTHLPVLFSIDEALGITDGFTYSLDHSEPQRYLQIGGFLIPASVVYFAEVSIDGDGGDGGCGGCGCGG